MSAAPIVANLATSASYTENATGIVIAPALTVSDVDSSTLSAATVRISAGSFAGAGDTLGVNLAVTNGTVSGTNIHVSYNAANGTLLLSGTDTTAHYQDVLRHVVYSSSSDDPADKGGALTRTIEWQVNDGSVPAGPVFGSPVVLGTGSDPRAVTTGDFNGDGNLDIAAANQNSNTVSVLLGDGHGGFATAANFATGLSPTFVAAADFNRDGKPDLAV